MKRTLLGFAVAPLVFVHAAAARVVPTLRLGRDTAAMNIAASPDGRTLAVVAVKNLYYRNEKPVRLKENATGFSYSSSLQTWDIQKRKLIRVLFSDPNSDPRSVTFSPDGRTLACGIAYWEAQLWDMKTDKRISTLFDIGGPETPSSIAFSPDGKTLATGWANTISENWGRVILWDVSAKPDDMNDTLRRVTGGKCDIWSIAFSPDGKTVVSGSGGYSRKSSAGSSVPDRNYGELRFIEAKSGKLQRLIKTKTEGIGEVCISPDGKLLATAAINFSSNSNVRLRDAKTGKLFHTIGLNKLETAAIAFSPDGKLLAMGRTNGTVSLWNTQTNRIEKAFSAGRSAVRDLTFVPRSRTLITASEDGTIKIWKL